ncbi:hypothetical protein ACFX1R_007247 [Malus domestica]
MDVELLHCPYIGWQLESGLNFSKILHGAMVLDLSGPDVDTGHKMKLLVTDVDADTNGHRRGRMRADLFCNDDLDEHATSDGRLKSSSVPCGAVSFACSHTLPSKIQIIFVSGGQFNCHMLVVSWGSLVMDMQKI